VVTEPEKAAEPQPAEADTPQKLTPESANTIADQVIADVTIPKKVPARPKPSAVRWPPRCSPQPRSR
jgi:hypothetical protein